MDISEKAFLEALSEHHKKVMSEPPNQSQITAWINSFNDLQKSLTNLKTQLSSSINWSIIFEYVLPRERGRRPDVIIIGGNDIFVLEFKDYSTPQQPHLDQVSTYARDLKNYHELSHQAQINPILVLRKYKEKRVKLGGIDVCNPDSLSEVIIDKYSDKSDTRIDISSWVEAAYDPLPSLVSAARYVFKNEKFPRIKRADSDIVWFN